MVFDVITKNDISVKQHAVKIFKLFLKERNRFSPNEIIPLLLKFFARTFEAKLHSQNN